MCLSVFLVFSTAGFAKTFEFKFQSGRIGSLSRAAAEKFIELVNEKTDHEVKAEHYLSGEIAKGAEAAAAVKMGLLDMSVNSPSWDTCWDTRMGMLEIPFLWSSDTHFQNYVLERGGGDRLAEILIQAVEVRPLCWYHVGFRWMWFKNKINSVEDLKKVRMRVPGGKVYQDMAKIVDIPGITIDYSEIFTSLQTGLVEAVEMPVALTYEERFYEVINYGWPSNHMICPQYIGISENLWQSLPSDLREAMEEAAYETSYYMYGLTPLNAHKALRVMKEEQGLQVIYDVDPAPLRELFVDYQMEWAQKNNCVDMMEEILAMK